MKTDVNGCSTTEAGEEQYELVDWRGGYYQYDYRTPDGILFSTVARSLVDCRKKRDEWLAGLR